MGPRNTKLLLAFSLFLLLAQAIMSAAQQDEKTEVKMHVQVRKGTKVVEYHVEAIPCSYAGLGKSPQWVEETQSIYYVDFDGVLLRYDYREDKIYSCKLNYDGMPIFLIPVEGTTDKFAIALLREVIIVTWDGKSDTCKVDRTLFQVETGAEFSDNRMNVGKCDSRGRLFVGTMLAAPDEFAENRGTLYKYDKGKVESLISGLGISNGMAFDDKLKKFYFIDTGNYVVREYDYDLDKGIPSNPKVILNTYLTPSREQLKLPDGMTIDADGNLYITLFNMGTIYKFDPRTRKILLEIKLPCKQVSSAAFGGPNMDILYVATSSRFDEPSPAGHLFKVTGLGSRGLPQPKLKL